MAVSGSSDYSRTGQQIIRRAFKILGITQAGEVPSAEEQTDALEALELMIKTWQASDVHLWTEEEATLFLTASMASYSLPGARCVSSFVETTTTAAASATDTSITVASITGISDNDILGIQTSSTSIDWTTVNGTPAGSTVNFDDGLSADVASGSTVYAYSSSNLIVRPLRIENIRREYNSIETPAFPLSRQEYFDLPNKSNTGAFNQWYYNPSRSTGVLYLWPAPQTVNDTAKLTWLRPIQDFDSASNDPDLPQEWLETLAWNLAVRLMPEYGIRAANKPEVVAMAQTLLTQLEAWDSEMTSVYIQPAML